MSINSFIQKLLFKKSPYREVGIGWIQEKIIKHRQTISPKSITISGKKVNYLRDEEIVHCLKEIFFEKAYAFETKKLNPYIIDCGSHIGMSILYYKKVFKNAIIKGFEPDKVNFEILNKNIAEWGFNDIEVLPNPVWNNDEEIIFETAGAMGGKINKNQNTDQLSQRLKAIRLADLLVQEIDFLKIDIEGAEFEVLMDCKDKLHFVKNLFIEFHSNFQEEHKLIEILSVLKKSGFNFYIKEANNIYPIPFSKKKSNSPFDIQLNIFATRDLQEN